MSPRFEFPCKAFPVLAGALAAVLLGGMAARADSVVVFNEIQYHPWDPAAPEWIELHNQMAINVDLSGWRLRGGADYDFPTGTVIPAGGYLLVSSDPGGVGLGSLGPWSGSLSNGGEQLRLRNNSGRLMDEIDYGDRGVWPIGADGSGATLAKEDEDTASSEPGNWRASAQVDGTPGAPNFPQAGMTGPEVVIVPIDATWRYNESGVGLPAGWAASPHSTGAGGWEAGPALLGFETTPDVLPEPLQTTFADPESNSIITYYFEIDFELSAAQVASIDRLLLRHVIDDGAIFYLNGVEAGPRFNMDAGVVDPTTTAAVVRNAEYQGPFELPTGALLPGTNRFSVEVHQQASTSSDIIFGATLSMTQTAGGAAQAPLLISEISGTGDGNFRIEIANTKASAFAAGGVVLASRGFVDASYIIPAPVSIAGGDFLVIDEATLGFRPGNDDRLFLFTPGQEELIHAARADDLPRAWSAEHGRMLVPDAESFGLPNTFAINSDIVINEIMYHFREDPGVDGNEPIIETTELIPIDGEWRYNESGVELAPGWQTSAHRDDGVAWFTGPALLGFEFGNLPEPIRTPLASPAGNSIVTYYFEREFEVSAAQLAGNLSLELQHVIDDGAVFYVNGVEAGRYNMPGGAVVASTQAASSIRDAVYEGPSNLPTNNLVVGTNRLSVELHQDDPTNSDIVFGLVLNAVVEFAPPAEAQPIVERDEEWVELFNKGTEEVDLTGWSIDGGIDFNFPADTRIAGGGYLVVAQDAAVLAAKYPGLGGMIVGDYRNRLNNSRDVIRLEDAVENPVDEVHYVEGGRWPGLADGRGPSLELRDPDADNSNPQAWAASDESAKEGWQTITYQDRGGQSYGLTNWNEFRLGMLQDGEVLIDDVSVVRDPTGAAEELIQNGSFSAGAARWRLIGNHRHSSVISEPGNPGNQVLHLVATGATDTRHNHLESTFVNNTAITTAGVYEVSFRARWLSGSNQLNSRCYYQRLARTTQLNRPEDCGTPGAPNSRLEGNIGPTFSDLRHDPPVPGVNESIVVSANVSDPDGLGGFTLMARYEEGGVQSFPFQVDAAGRGQGNLPGAAAGDVIQFWIEGEDALGAGSTGPSGGPDSRALIQVEDGQGRTNLPLQEIRLILLDSDRNFMLQTLNLMSNERLGGTAIYNRRTITYDVGVRLRGSGAGRARDGSSYQSFSIAFPDDQLFRGVHGSVGADRSGRSPVARRPDEIYVKHMFNHAGVPCMYDDLVHMVGPSPTYTGIAMLQMARYGSLFASTQFENGGNGSVFNLDITYDPVSSQGGVEGFKPPVPFQHIGTDIRDLGDSEEDYRTSFEIRTGRRRDDYSSLIAFCKTMSAPTAELDAQIESVMDVDEWMRYTALTLLCGIGDTFVNGGLRHNIRMFAPQAGPVVALPWDSDFVFNSGTSSSMLPGGGNLSRVVAIPRFRRLYWGHVHDLVTRTFNASYMSDWLDHYGQVIGANLSGQASYITSRGNHALGQLPANVPFSITTNGGGDFSVNETKAVLEGQGWINVREFRLAGSRGALPAEWLDGDSWRVEVPLLPGANPIDLEIYDFGGELIETRSLTITSTVTAPQPVEFLRITELHFNPMGGDATEFVELKNVGSLPLEIGGVHFNDGIAFTVPENTVLDPGAFVLVVRDLAAFAARYGPGLPVVGAFEPDGLSNDGERIELRDGSGNVIHDFSYSDQWFPATDGGGYSLVVRDENASVSAWNTVAGWGISGEPGGNPNADNFSFSAEFEGWQNEHFTVEELGMPEVSGALADANGDGMVNLLKYTLGIDPWAQTPPGFLPRAEVVNNRLRLLVRRTKNAVDLQIVAEFGSDLANWLEVSTPLGPPIDHGDGTETVVFEDTVLDSGKRFGRMRVTLSSP